MEFGLNKLKKWKVLVFNGNLGNQVFYCAFKNYLESKYNGISVYMYIMPGCPKIKVASCFDLSLPKQNTTINIIVRMFLWVDTYSQIIFHITLFNNFICRNGSLISENATIFTHYLQNKYYYKDKSSKWLKIKLPKNLHQEYLRYEEMIKNEESISIHIRRGDYVGSIFTDLSSTDYYDKAISFARMKYPTAKLFFFSDDLEYVKNKYKYDNSYFVDCNRGDNSYLDIKLMSLANVNIIANSSFSYWGAYINNENKTVIYPRNWFIEESNREIPDIILDSWIGM